MKKIACLSFLFFIGCGESFKSWMENTTGSGGDSRNTESSSTSDSGESSSIVETMYSTNTTAEPAFKKIEIHKECQKPAILIPPQASKDAPVVSCYLPAENEYPKTIYGFEYATWGGVYDLYGCEKNNQMAVWFVDLDNPLHQLSDSILFEEKYIDTSEVKWFDTTINQQSGPMAYIPVVFDEPVVLEYYPQMFCSGRRLTFTNDKPDCPIGCNSEYEMYRHQWAMNAFMPYEFKAVNDFPISGLGAKVNHYSVVYVNE